MENVRIMVMDANGRMCSFLDNSAPGAMHYWNDRLHTYLRGSAYTFEFRTFTSHEDSAFLAVGNSLSFTYRGRGYYLSIMTAERSEDYTDVTAYGLSLELTNEETGPYKAASAMSFSQYVDAFNFEKPFTIGINEVSDKRITHEWEGSDTILSRLFSLADVFGAEIEFTTELNDDYSLKQMTMNVYREHGDDCQGIGSDMRKGTPLRYGRQVSGITKKSDITELYTAIRPTGTDGLTLAGIDMKEYDSSGSLEYTSPSGTIEILAPQARDRFPSTLMADVNGRYICKVWSYETSNVNVLYGQALAQLKKLSVPEVSYTVEGFTDGDIGDTYTIEDDEYRPALYLEARITEQEISFTDESQSRTTFDNFREVQSEISSALVDEMKKLISDKRMYDASISTDNGILFKDRSGKSVLTAVIKDGGADVTSRLAITWYRDGTKTGEGQSITVSASDFDDKAVYGYKALASNGTLKGTCEVTCMFLENGAAGENAYLHIMYADDDKGTGMTSSPSGKKYMGQYSDSSMYNSQDASRYKWSLIQGPKGNTGPQGPKGDKGADGKGIKSTAMTYQAGSSQTSAPAGLWLTSVPKLSPAAPYLWTKTVITYTDGNTSTSFSVSSTLDGIEIGGRNLWINSSRYRESTPYSKTDSGTDNYAAYFDGKCIYSIEPFKAGDIITIQGKSNLPWAKKHGGDSTNNGTVGYWLYYGTLEQVKTGNHTLPVFVSLDGVSTVFKKTLTIPSISGLDTIYIAFRFNSYSYNSVSITAKFWDIKLEKGNKATDWTPAPEDVHDIEIEPSAPSDKTRLWYDTNSSLLKKYDESSGDWMVVNDASDDINSSAQAITAAYTSSIEKVKNSITSSVDVAVSRIDSNEKTIDTLSTQIQQNAGAITATTNTVKSVTDSLSGYTTKVEISEWARFSNGVLELGKSSSNFSTKLSNTELGFYEIGKRIAFISNQELNITKARILDKMYIGGYLVDDDDDYGFIIM